jgi:hypothetical protein
MWRRNREHLNQRSGVAEHVAAEGDQDPRLVPDAGGRDEAAISGAGAIAKKWTKPVKDWKAALQRFTILLGYRVPKAGLA